MTWKGNRGSNKKTGKKVMRNCIIMDVTVQPLSFEKMNIHWYWEDAETHGPLPETFLPLLCLWRVDCTAWLYLIKGNKKKLKTSLKYLHSAIFIMCFYFFYLHHHGSCILNYYWSLTHAWQWIITNYILKIPPCILFSSSLSKFGSTKSY